MLELIDAERAHDCALGALSLAQRFDWALGFLKRRYHPEIPDLSQNIWNLRFTNPIGLAAGWDKNARVPKALAALGFGCLELGTVTLKPEIGNPRPRIFRSFKEQWILNRVGFANDGAHPVQARLREFKSQDCVIGISLGKNIASPPELLVQEVSAMMELFYPYVDFFTVNISSPNTPQRLELEKPDFLRNALIAIQKEKTKIAINCKTVPKPVLVKIGPITSEDQLNRVAEAIMASGIDGVIATNTLPTDKGGLSGLPLRSLALKTTSQLFLKIGKRVPIIGVGGILRPEDAWVRLTAGARLVQIFSGFVFSGPGLIRKTLEYFQWQMKASGLKSLEEACGVRAEEFAK